VIVTFAPGGPTDVAARLIAQKLSESLGRQFYVENVAGASGNIGTVQAAKAAPDGYTLLITVNNLVINPPLFGNVTYDPYKNFDPVAMAVGFSSAFSVHPSVPVKNVNELIAHIKANPGKLSFASAPALRVGIERIERVARRHEQAAAPKTAEADVPCA
jgi:tripartite-type tricarboxylate transporter receptor subunit TctC